MGNHKNPFFSLYSTHMVGVFYLDSNLIPITLKKYIKKKKKAFESIQTLLYLRLFNPLNNNSADLSPQIPCDPSINPHHPSAVCTGTIIISGFVL